MKPDLLHLAGVLAGGGVVLLPTDTIYGLHAVAADAAAIEKLVRIKGRDADKPFVVLAASLAQIEALRPDIDDSVKRVLQELWPGPLTAIVAIDEPLAASRGARTIAVRVPDLDWLRDLVARTGPLASTSVNRSGELPISSPQELSSDLQNSIDAIYDAGRLEGKPSTIVDFTGGAPRVVRDGDAFFTQKVWKTLRKSL
jgi:tRNA threonylcarbamoyl adenosine modification protein (Sua5/YciO/YrdC/YwlC family)